MVVADVCDYLRNWHRLFDYIVLDLVDPGVARHSCSGSLDSALLREVAASLAPDGLVAVQTGEFAGAAGLPAARAALQRVFPWVETIGFPVPSFNAQWSVTFAGHRPKDLFPRGLGDRITRIPDTRFYTHETVHKFLFTQSLRPVYMEEFAEASCPKRMCA